MNNLPDPAIEASKPALDETQPERVCDLLTPRQRQVFHWICEGKRDREIATILGISYRTVTVHVRDILQRLGAENRTSAAMMGIRGPQNGGEANQHDRS